MKIIHALCKDHNDKSQYFMIINEALSNAEPMALREAEPKFFQELAARTTSAADAVWPINNMLYNACQTALDFYIKAGFEDGVLVKVLKDAMDTAEGLDTGK